MNLPNKLTMLRICMIPVFVIFALIQQQWAQYVALLIYILACLTDLLDGKIARKNNLVTDFGKFADPIADKLLVMAALVVLVESGRMPGWVCIVMLAREFIISGFRLVAAGGGKVIAAGKLGKLKTVFQMSATIALLLLVPVAGAPLLGNFGVVLANVLTYIAAALTIISGAEYIIKNFDCIKDM
ncbi:MAG: CDP-diacylglycerol--glycerol-3-phosphate 3-phosphatidyltransferase [Clostridia bacterium]|nr:CDP-diacylglycerol--glycerol-3-phosphate 3-phosphatidyltransferase [Clostridia bacterium]